MAGAGDSLSARAVIEARRQEKLLDTFPYGNVLLAHGTSNDNLGCVQCRGGAAAARDFELSGAAGAASGENCGLAGAGAALGFEAPARFARGGPCRRTPRRPADVYRTN